MNYYDDNVGVDLFENAKFVDAEGGKIEAMELSGKLVGSGEVRFGANLTFTLLREKIAGFIATEKRGGVRLFFKKCRFRRLARLVKWISATFALPKERREKPAKPLLMRFCGRFSKEIGRAERIRTSDPLHPMQMR